MSNTDFIDEHTFFKMTEKELSLSPEEKNNIYHSIEDIINNNSQDISTKIVLLIEDLLNERKINMASKFIDRSEGKTSKIFRRIG
jgi:hypothetical protein